MNTGISADQLEVILQEADWMMQMVQPDGAFANYPDMQQIRPYMAHFGAIGFVRASEASGNTEYVDAAWRWAHWYASKMDETGFVTDFNWIDGQWVSTGDMDSTDSYAALYMVLLEELYRVTGDISNLRSLADSVEKSVTAIEATMDVDGLTWAKPTYHVKYLMDNAETYVGLLAGGRVAAILSNAELSEKANSMAQRMCAGLESLWNEETMSYARAVNQAEVEESDWDYYYNDAVSQAWAVAFGIPDAERSSAMMNLFEERHSYWNDPGASGPFRNGDGPVMVRIDYWPVVGWAHLLVGNTELASEGVGNIRRFAIDSGRAWPYTSKTAGEIIIFSTGGLI